MAKRAHGLSQQIADDAVGISVRSAQRIDRGDHQSQNQPQRCRSWGAPFPWLPRGCWARWAGAGARACIARCGLLHASGPSRA